MAAATVVAAATFAAAVAAANQQFDTGHGRGVTTLFPLFPQDRHVLRLENEQLTTMCIEGSDRE